MVLKIFNFHDILIDENDNRLKIEGLLNIKNFENKIIYLKNNFINITFKQFLNQDYNKQENNCIITFDDGLLCHYEIVLPLLKKHNLIASFFITGLPLFEEKVTNPHKIQFLISYFDDNLDILLREIFLIFNNEEKCNLLWKKYSVTSYKNNTWSKQKIFITNLLREKIYIFICDKLFDKYILEKNNISEKEFVKNFYLDKEKIKILHKEGMEIGGHGYTHNPNDNSDKISLLQEFLLNIGVKNLIYSYPNGVVEKNLIKNNNFIIGLKNSKGDVSENDNLLELNRYDCRDIKENKKRIALCGVQIQGLEICDFLKQNNIIIDYLITIDNNLSKKNKASGWVDYTNYGKENNIKIYYCKSYSLKNQEDIEFFKTNNFDIILLGGWQRLIPNNIIININYGIIGQHGSSELLPRGRGRSPINWSIILNKKRLIWNIFFLKPGIDDGNIIDYKIIEINDYDNCDTIYKKISIIVKKMYLINIPKILKNECKTIKQVGEATYYKKRTPKDGLIDWKNSIQEIYNIIRAITKPYPGAFSYIGLDKIMIWKAQPFDKNIIYIDKNIGEIVEIFEDKSFVINCVDGTLLITDYDYDKIIYKGDIFNNYLLNDTLLK